MATRKKDIMSNRKSKCLMASINLNLLGKKRKFSLNHFLNSKSYNVDEIYGAFSDDYTFRFVRESSIPFEEWEEVQDKSPFTYYELVHKRQYQLFSMEDGSYLTEPCIGDIPWQKEESMEIAGHRTITICAKKFVPKNFIRHNKISDVELDRFSRFITKILATNPSLLEEYFPQVEAQKTI